MNSRAPAVFWLVFGGLIAAGDMWLSVNSLFGLWQRDELFAQAVAVLAGIVLTGFAVGEPVAPNFYENPGVRVLWIASVIVDVVSSVIGAIWYGVLGEPFFSPIDLNRIGFLPGNWGVTAVFILVVLFAMYACRRFGWALHELSS